VEGGSAQWAQLLFSVQRRLDFARLAGGASLIGQAYRRFTRVESRINVKPVKYSAAYAGR
jgi:hypothetical protein